MLGPATAFATLFMSTINPELYATTSRRTRGQTSRLVRRKVARPTRPEWMRRHIQPPPVDLAQRDLRHVFHLLGEMQELARDPVAQQQHLLDTLCSQLHCRQGFAVVFAAMPDTGWLQRERAQLSSDPDPDYVGSLLQWDAAAFDVRQDYFVDAFTKLDAWRRPMAFRRGDLVEVPQWFSREDYDETLRGPFVTDNLALSLPLPVSVGAAPIGPDKQPIFAISLIKSSGETAFSDRDVAFAGHLNREMLRLLRRGRLFSHRT